MNLYLQNIVQSISINTLPVDWLDFDFETFSNSKKLFDFQQKALENALKALYKFYEENNADKSNFFQLYQDNGMSEDLSYKKKEDSKTFKYLEEYSNDYIEKNGQISFEHFINRMSFWMATGSGKTLVIVKLIEMLGTLINKNELPQKDILFLTYRDDLLDQFKNHIDEFNSSHNNVKINLKSLKEYETVKRDNPISYWSNEITVFYYRSDLITDKRKDKQVNFRTYDNNGNWFIILDEAHKGDKEDSKRQMFYNILSRNGFLFNFSATFTDDRDFATCVYNYNLAEYVRNGYGKHVYLSEDDITAFQKNTDFTEEQKQRIVLKILILQTIIRKHYEQIKKYDVYHNPLILTLVNSVNTKDSDLELFFKELAKFAQNNTSTNLFEEVKNELKEELKLKTQTLFDDENIKYNDALINSVSAEDVLKYVFNAEKNGAIEVLMLPGNKQELIFKLVSSNTPFALIKIGDISQWLKNKLLGYTIIESFDNESYFRKLNNDDSTINILMGSRSFYEGWDSNRPNIVLFINIGTGNDAKKFVLQSVGRGVRIQPLKDKRQRLIFLHNSGQIDKNLFDNIKEYYKPLETLYVFGTNAKNLKEVISILKQENPDVLLGDLFDINPDIKDKTLLIPQYKKSNKLIIEEQNIIKFPINDNDYDEVKNYFNYINEKIILCKYDCNIRVLNKIKNGFNGNKNEYFLINNNIAKISNPQILLSLILKHFSDEMNEFSDFKELENEIIHFKHIKITQEKLDSLREKIENVKNSKHKEQFVNQIDKKFDTGEISKEEYKQQIKNIDLNIVKECVTKYGENEKIIIKLVPNHYYIPLVLSETDKADYIQHIIKVKSEKDFIDALETYLQNPKNKSKNYTWWFFSKIDETLDEIYIPYYNPKTNRIDKFKPDFIFWMVNDESKEYQIVFVDPKGTEYTDAYRKIDGYSRIFEEEINNKKQSKTFLYNEYSIKTKLLLKIEDNALAINHYKEYWSENIEDIFEKI